MDDYMSIEETATKHIIEAYLSQDLYTLNAWVEKFPDGWYWLTNHLGDLPLKDAIERKKWRLVAFLLETPNLPEKVSQISMAAQTGDIQISMLIESHFNKLQSTQIKLALFLQERTLW